MLMGSRQIADIDSKLFLSGLRLSRPTFVEELQTLRN